MKPLELARRYLARGWAVLPCQTLTAWGNCSCARGADCASPAKHPRTAHGVSDATHDARDLEREDARTRGAWNVAIATGCTSSLVVVDVDPRNGGREGLDRLQIDCGALPPTAMVATGGGGWHLYFALAGAPAPACRTHVGGYQGVDVKGHRGYVLAPPSLHASGRRYEWLGDAGDELAIAPRWLLELAGFDHAPARVTYAPMRDPSEISRRAELVLRSPRIRARFERNAAGLRDVSPSGVDASLAALLAGAGLRGDEIEAALRESRARAGEREKRPSYYAATIGRALAAARERASA